MARNLPRGTENNLENLQLGYQAPSPNPVPQQYTADPKYKNNQQTHCNINQHKHQGFDLLIRSVCRVTSALANVSSVFQLFFFLVVCSDMTSKGLGLVAFFASVKASSVCIHLSCPVCTQSVVHGVRSRLFCGHEGCSLPEVSITSFLPLQFFVSVRLSESNFLTHIEMQAKPKCCIFSK